MTAATLIRIPEIGNATLLEIIWTLIGAATLAIVTWNYSGAKASLVTPIHLTDEHEIRAAEVIRRGYLRREAVRFITAGLILATGVTGCIVSPISRPSVTTVTGLVLTVAFFIIGLLNVAQSFFDQHDRHEVRDLLMRSRRAQAAEEHELTRRRVGL